MSKYGYRDNRLYVKKIRLDEDIEVKDSGSLKFGEASIQNNEHRIVLNLSSAAAGTCAGAIFVATVDGIGGVLRIVQ